MSSNMIVDPVRFFNNYRKLWLVLVILSFIVIPFVTWILWIYPMVWRWAKN